MNHATKIQQVQVLQLLCQEVGLSKQSGMVSSRAQTKSCFNEIKFS